MLIKYLIQAYRGKYYWTILKRKYGNGKMPSRYILFPENDDEYNAWGLLFMESYIEKNHLNKVIVLTSNADVYSVLDNINHINLCKKMISAKKMTCLVRYSALVPRNKEWTIVSVKQPYDTGAERLLGKKGVGKKEIVWYDIYRMSKDIDLKKLNKFNKWNNANKFLKYLLISEIH